MFNAFIRTLSDNDMYHYMLNPQAFVILARRESVLSKPTHFCLYSDYTDSMNVLRLGFKEAMQPFNLEDFDITLQDNYEYPTRTIKKETE